MRAIGTRRVAGLTLTFVLLFGLTYGAVMGSFGGISGDRALQVLVSAGKVPFLLIVTFSLSAPSFFVLNTLVGLREDMAAVLRALLASQTGFTIVLASLAPFTAFWYAGSANYQAALLFNAGIFAAAAFAAQLLLRRYYAPLIRANPRHRSMMYVWWVLYGFVGIQMSWVLRPFVGAPWSRVELFRHDAWGNAYEAFLKIAVAAFRGH
jgi:hypothetical protein